MKGTKHQLSQNEYTTIRDHIFSTILFTNASRSGVPANMMMDEFNSAKKLPDGRFLITVKNIKHGEHMEPPMLL